MPQRNISDAERVLQNYQRFLESQMAGAVNQRGTINRADISAVVNDSNEMQLFYATGGLLTDPNLERPIMNTLIQPMESVSNTIPFRLSNIDKVKFGFLTSIEEAATETNDLSVCDDSPSVGEVDFNFAEFARGRVSYQSKTGEIDALIRRASKGVVDNLYFVGDIRGARVMPNSSMMNDPNLVQLAAVRFQMMLIGRALNRILGQWLWIGDPTDVTQNSTGGNWKSFWGLQYLVENDYAAKTFITGTGDKTQLNSIVIDFGNTNVCDSYNGVNMYRLLSSTESAIYNRAQMAGLSMGLDVRIVMHPHIWEELYKCIACQMVDDKCSPSSDSTLNVINNSTADIFTLSMREQIARTRQLTLNGRTYTVQLDAYMPITQATVNGQVQTTGDIYFIPYLAGGEQVLYWEFADYTEVGAALAPIPNSMDMYGWTDGGIYHAAINYVKRCFTIDVKTEPSLVFRAPHLAAKIENVMAAPEVTQPVPIV